MRRITALMAALAAFVLLTAMGAQPGPEIPRPEIDFEATVTDDQDISTQVRQAAWEGQTYFIGTRGKGVVTVPFQRVAEVAAVGSGEKGERDFRVTLRNGDVVAVSFNEGDRFTGETSFGTYKILARNIKKIEFR